MSDLNILYKLPYKIKRIEWIDFIKGIAIFIVTLGHVISGLMNSPYFSKYKDILSLFYEGFFCSFNMPLFFMVSGLLYANRYHSTSASLKKSLLKKIIALGIPYLIFSLLLWTIKYFMGTNVRKPVTPEDLLLIPIHPLEYLWFLYVLFLVYSLIEILDYIFKNNSIVIIIICGLTLARWFCPVDIFVIDKSVQMGIYFYIGKLVKNNLQIFKNNFFVSICFVIFVSLKLIDIQGPGIEFIIAVTACFTIISLCLNFSEKNNFFFYFAKIGKITLPVYLIHPIIAAAVRILLLKIGVQNIFSHLIIGLFLSWTLSIYLYKLCSKYKYSDIIFYPTKYIKI